MNLVWLRNDIRLHDNPALHEACKTKAAVKVIFIATPKQWELHNEAPAKLGFRAAALTDLSQKLAEHGIAFELLEVDDFNAIPNQLAEFCLSNNITTVWFNREIPSNEQSRDNAVCNKLKSLGINYHITEADLLVSTPIVNHQNQPYRVFTPWYNAWIKRIASQSNTPVPFSLPSAALASQRKGKVILLPGSSTFRDDLWSATEEAAQNRLLQFSQRRLLNYAEHRDFPAINGTSTLSPYLANGLISAKCCLQAIQKNAFQQGWDWRESTWLRELGWREFYRHLMLSFPHVSQDKPFKKTPENWPWQQIPTHISGWQRGETGFPIVDAAMRQLVSTGWMHNRLRMIVAVFLCKLLLVDWREGERFFMRHLIDGDFASNNGGWQWCASTGCDASPWFRIFNPLTQSQKFDPDGSFIRKFIPELSSLDNKQIHNPSASERASLGYAAPIIDYKSAREQALRAFQKS